MTVILGHRMDLSWITIVSLLIFHSNRSIAQPSPCLLRCKDDHFNQIRAILGDESDWSTDMVTPFQSILRGAPRSGNAGGGVRSTDYVMRKLSAFCQANRKFVNCLNECEESDARRVLVIGQKSWTIICGAFREDRDFRRSVAPCWAQHGTELGRRCEPRAQAVQRAVLDLIQQRNNLEGADQRVSLLCSTITEYDMCYIWASDRLCGEKSWQFLLELNEKTSNALLELLRESRLVSRAPPTECAQWSTPDAYSAWHTERVFASRRAALNRGSPPAKIGFTKFVMFVVVVSVFIGNN